MEESIRPAVDTDSAGIIDLIASVYAEYPGNVLDVDAEEPELRSPGSSFERFWVLDRGGEVVGCCGLETHGDTVVLKKLYLYPELRGRGHARALVDRVESHAREVGAIRIELWTDTRFVPAHGFYAHLGYVRTGRTRDLHDLSHTTEYEFVKELR
jgi:GNAT superfamily N-acetyltransferase